MVDTNLFRYIMRKNGDNMDTLATALGISRTALSLKINNKKDFRLNEVRMICGRYNLTVEVGCKLFEIGGCC